MSDLWDYDDDEYHGSGDGWEVPPQDDAVVEVEDTTHKRIAGRKPTKASKRRAVPPATSLELRPAPMPTTILLDDSDEDDDLVLITSPEVNANANRGGAAGFSGTTGVARSTEPIAAKPSEAKPGVATLNPATRESLAREEELLRALQQVTEREHQQDDGMEASPVPRVSALSHLGLSRLTSRRPVAGDTVGAKPTAAPVLSDDDVVVAANVPVLGSAGAQNALGKGEPAGGPDDTGANGAGARVQLKLVWGRDKDDTVKMRVVKTDSFSKMIEKFKAYATERSLCRDPNKIKFLFDGDDLAKMPSETPESMDMEDDMMIDVKL